MSPAERRLTRAAPGPAEGFVSVTATARGLRLHIRQRPDPDPVAPVWVLLHGLAVSHRYLMPTAVALPGSVFVPDLPGFGLSGKPSRVLTTEQHAAVVATWMDTAGLTAANVLGNSFGCQVAVELAVARPDLVATLVLDGPTVDPAAPTAGGQIRRWAHDLLIEDPQQVPTILTDVRDAGPRRVLGTLRHSVGHHIDRRIPLVAAPILVLRGQYDPIAPARWAAQAASLARDGHTGAVPRAAHNAVTSAGPVLAAQAAAFAAAAGDRSLALDRDTPAADARRLVEEVVHDWDMTDRADDPPDGAADPPPGAEGTRGT
jgi:pimeloyl-ACP methyl ester carboxylesterase